MIDALLRFSIARRWVVLFLVLVIAGAGVGATACPSMPSRTSPMSRSDQHQCAGLFATEVEQRSRTWWRPRSRPPRCIHPLAVPLRTFAGHRGVRRWYRHLLARNLINERLQQARARCPRA